MSLGELAKVGLDVARALAFAHAAGITHNDVKSHNVLFNAGGAAVLVDFGLAKRVRAALPNTMASMLGSSSGGGGGMLGTISHCAPENFDDESPHYGQPAGDVYSFGMVLFEIAVGVQPWEGRNIAQVMGAVTGGRRPVIPAAWVVVLRCIKAQTL
jgi:serine/threonine protein kinase